MSVESLDGTLARVIYHGVAKWNPAGVPFLIGKLDTGITVKGELRKPVEGERYRFWGEYRPQKGRPEPAFEFQSYEVIVDQTTNGVARYLAEYISGIGPTKARAIVDHFGVDTLTILRKSPERLAEVQAVTITEANVEATRKHFAEANRIDPVAYAELIDMFKDLKIAKRTIQDLAETHGSAAPGFIRDNPYQLLAYPRIGWQTADKFALTVCNYDPDGLDRHKCAIMEGLQRLALEGHTYGTMNDILAETVPLLGRTPRLDAWDSLTRDRQIIAVEHEDEPAYALSDLHNAELSIASQLAALMAGGEPLGYSLVTEKLQGEQVEAARIIEQNPVALLCGPPGTGKSFVAAQIIKSILDAGENTEITYVAPTGKAAKRGSELLEKNVPGCGIRPSTIHRALGPTSSKDDQGVPASSAKTGRGRDEFGFQHGSGNPIETDWLIVDEASMVDAKLMAALLRSITPGTRVIFVGDQNQLPSVGPGSVLRDMIEAGVPCAMLNEIRRSDGGGSVVQACHAIKDGRVPSPAASIDLEAGKNWVHIERSTPAEIAATIAELHKPGNIFKDLYWDFQVVTPRNGRSIEFAVDALNDLLGPRVNPIVDPLYQEDERGRPPFRIGDKVVRTKNGECDELSLFTPDSPHSIKSDWAWDGQEWSTDEGYVVNGDMGIVRDVLTDSKGSHVVVQFVNPDRLCRLPMSDHNIMQAYAMTCHKCQGSGFPFVVVPIHESVYEKLATREWFYTAISRTEKLLVTVGTLASVSLMVGRKTVHLRRTTLHRQIEQCGVLAMA